MYVMTFYESTLIGANNIGQVGGDPFRQGFSKDLAKTMDEANWPVILDLLRILFLLQKEEVSIV